MNHGPGGRFWGSQMATKVKNLGVFVVNRVRKEYLNIFSQKGRSCPLLAAIGGG